MLYNTTGWQYRKLFFPLREKVNDCREEYNPLIHEHIVIGVFASSSLLRRNQSRQ